MHYYGLKEIEFFIFLKLNGFIKHKLKNLKLMLIKK